jgi:HlyD family secretion protein/adhesin transport system membrane fusion protein
MNGKIDSRTSTWHDKADKAQATRAPASAASKAAPAAPRPRTGLAQIGRLAHATAKKWGGGSASGRAQVDLLGQAAALEESTASRFSRIALALGSALVLVAIAWSALTQLDEVASGPGEIVPEPQIAVVQHLEGGIVAAIYVKDGDLVEKDRLLLRLRGESAEAELQQLRAREAALNFRAQRLLAFVTGERLNPESGDATGRYGDLVKEEMAVLKLQEQTRDLQRSMIDRQIEQKRSQLAVLKEQEASLRKQLRTVGESLELREEGTKKGVVSRALYLQTRREHERLLGEISETMAQIIRVDQEYAEVKVRLAEHDARVSSEAMGERGKVLGELAQVRENLLKLEDRVRRLEIRAPVRGYIKGLRVNAADAVITSDGKPLMEIVPADSRLIVEARISTRDIGHVRIGQTVKVRVDTYDFARYGAIPGKVENLSATTFLDKEGRPYYRATVALERSHVGPRHGRLEVGPGMTVTADIVTGAKSLLAYMTKPVYVSLNSAFRER